MQRNRILLRCKSLLNISILSSWRLRRTHNSLESSLRSEKQFRMHAPFPGCIFILMYFAEYSATIMAAKIVWNKFCLKTPFGCHPRLESDDSIPQRSNHIVESTSVGRQAAVKWIPLSRMYISALLSTNIRFVFTSMSDLSLVLYRPIRVHTCVICLKEQ